MAHNLLSISPLDGRYADKVDYLSVQEFVSPVLDNSRNYLLSDSNVRPKDIKDISCRQPFERVTIRGDGAVLACCSHQSSKMSVGNIMTESLSAIWKNEKMEALRKSFFIFSPWE